MTWRPEEVPDRDALRLLLAAITGREPAGGLLELRWRRPDGGMGRCFHPAARARTLEDTARTIGARTDLYVGCAPRRRRHGGADAIERTWVLWADCDGPNATRALMSFTPAPSIVIATSAGHAHAWWALQEPLPARWATPANRRLAHHLDADPRSTDVARILRPPGTLNHKHGPPTPVRCVRLEPVVYDPRDVVGHLPDPPDPPAPAARPPRRDHGDDALRTIPAEVYVPELTGRELGRDRKITCPFHEDSTPSLHVYDEHWYCYGCGAGGTIIDLGARLYGIEPRGRGYHELRRRLARALLGATA